MKLCDFSFLYFSFESKKGFLGKVAGNFFSCIFFFLLLFLQTSSLQTSYFLLLFLPLPSLSFFSLVFSRFCPLLFLSVFVTDCFLPSSSSSFFFLSFSIAGFLKPPSTMWPVISCHPFKRGLCSFISSRRLTQPSSRI